MDEVDETTLHYAMLDYLFREAKLSKSCFDYTWQYFKEKQITDLAEDFTNTQLKTIFWRDVLPNIHQFMLLSNEQKEYFDSDELIGDLIDHESLENNSVKRGIDYECWKSRKEYLNSADAAVDERPRISEMEEIFKKPNVSDEKNIKIQIIDQDLSSQFIDELNISKRDDTKALIAALLTNAEVTAGIQNMTDDEMQNRLLEPNTLSDYDTLAMHKFSKFLKKVPLLKNMFGSEEDECEELVTPQQPSIYPELRDQSNFDVRPTQSDSSLQIPHLSMNSPQSSKFGSVRKTLSNIQTPQTPRMTTRATRKNVVVESSSNLKMTKFIKKHKERMDNK